MNQAEYSISLKDGTNGLTTYVGDDARLEIKIVRNHPIPDPPETVVLDSMLHDRGSVKLAMIQSVRLKLISIARVFNLSHYQGNNFYIFLAELQLAGSIHACGKR